MRQILIPDRTRFVNFTNPFNGRMWLAQLVPHARHGLRFLPNLDLPRKVLGFTFSSNEHGLRGPGNPEAPGVVLGTSFAMGLSVDTGANWYDLLLEPDQWFNAGMPVAPHNHRNLLDDLYSGSHETLLYIYHPNAWKTATGFVQAEEAGRTIFEHLGWSSGFGPAVRSYARWIPKELSNISIGRSLYRDWGDRRYLFHASYNYFAFEGNRRFIEQQMAVFRTIFERFNRVVAVRVPIKEELGVPPGVSQRIDALHGNYDTLWDYFRGAVPANTTCARIPGDLFGPADFHPYDTHWTARGNRTFAAALHDVLHEQGIGGIRDVAPPGPLQGRAARAAGARVSSAM